MGATRNDSGLVLRSDATAANCMSVFADPGGWYLQKIIAGSPTNVVNAGSMSAATTYALTVIMSGSSITLKVGGSTIWSTTVSDAAILTNTRHGLFAAAAATDHQWDNFQITSP